MADKPWLMRPVVSEIRMRRMCLIAAVLMFIGSGCGGGSSEKKTYIVNLDVSPSSAEVALGAKQQFTAIASGAPDTSVTWYVNGEKGGTTTYGTITREGLYTAPANMPSPSTVTVTAVSNANTNDLENVAVHLVSGIKVAIDPATVHLALGKTQQFTATVTGTSNVGLNWYVAGVSGGNTTVGTVSTSGLYTAPATASTPLSVTLTATSQVDPSKSATASITVHGRVEVSVSPSPASVPTFGTLQFAATVTGDTNTGVTWKINGVNGGSPGMGTITSSGLYSAPRSVPTRASGGSSTTTNLTVTAIAEADASASDSVVLTVYAPNQKHQPSPTPLGVSGGHADSSSSTQCCGGTLGALVLRGATQYILGTSHVLAQDGVALAGDNIVQPSLLDNGCSGADTTVVANLSRFTDFKNPPTATEPVDAALAQAIPGMVNPQGAILLLGDSATNGVPGDAAPRAGSGIPPAVGLAVAKSGRSTGLTCSTIGAIHVIMSVPYEDGCGSGATFSVTYTNLVDIFGGDFSAEGDAGSLIVTQDTADPVALLIASTDVDTVAIPVSDVLAALADPDTHESPVFVGSGPHSVIGCSLPSPQSSASNSAAVASTATATARNTLSREAIARAYEVQTKNLGYLMGLPGVQGVGIASDEQDSAKAALMIYLVRGYPAVVIPGEIDGMRTRIRLTNRVRTLAAGVHSTAACVASGTPHSSTGVR